VREALRAEALGSLKAWHLVAFFAWCYREVYGVEAVDLLGVAGLGARSAADKLVREQFDGDPGACVQFIRWAWYREREREAWRREHKRDGRRLDWRAQFVGRSLLAEYRLAVARLEVG
jgi:hypothetical protein